MNLDSTNQPLDAIWRRFGARTFGNLKKFRLRPGRHDQALESIKRLALVSPHLLADLGFTHDPHNSNPTMAVWHKGDIVVQIQRTERHVVVLRER